MTREEQRAKAAHEYIQSDSVAAGNEILAFGDFINGAKWADFHPHWISVEDEMPPFDWKEDGTWRRSLPVLIYDPTRGIFLGCYESDDLYGKTYWIYDNGKRPTKEVSGGYECDNVTHWMPLPEAPRKEDHDRQVP